MPAADRSVAAVRFFGDSLDPEELTYLLGRTPTSGFRKGDVQVGSRRSYVKKTGSWILDAARRKPEDLEAQIKELCSALTGDLAIWRELTSKYDADMYCGFFMETGSASLLLSPATLLLLSERRLQLQVEIYAPVDDEAGE